ncbi:MAG: E3 binding domain-containing protein [Deltaproteobacteria bacterium]|nr:E3 binding domain-containing protein [Deltaproteobacteria bacterium]
MQAVTLPILDANMTHGVIRAWMKQEGDAVQAGEPLFEVETDKINAEVEAEVSGVVRRIVVPVGEKVAVLSLLAFIGTVDEVVPAPEVWSVVQAPDRTDRADRTDPTDPQQAAPPRPAASPAARRLARERGLTLEGIRGTGVRGEITADDIEALSRVTVVAAAGRLDPAFLNDLRRDAGAFRTLSGDLKLRLYREHGADFGRHIRLDDGVILLAAEVHLGDGVTIGADSSFECDRLTLGPLAAFGKRTRARCRSITIGAALWSKDDVVIGGGGSDEAGAHLRAGDACFFGEAAYLNPCHPITLGDEVCIGSRAMLFTHSHWQSVLRGYRSLFGPIDVGNHVFIGNQAFVFPGVTIADGATVIVNSFVAVNVAASTMVGGVPAQVIRHVASPSLAERKKMVLDVLMPDLARALSERGFKVQPRDGDAGSELAVAGVGHIRFLPETDAAKLPAGRQIVLTFTSQSPPAADGVTLLDLAAARIAGEQDAFSDEVREFLRRRGVRFRPYAWRYGIGHWDGKSLVRR